MIFTGALIVIGNNTEHNETVILESYIAPLATGFNQTYIKFENSSGLYEIVGGEIIVLEDYVAQREQQEMTNNYIQKYKNYQDAKKRKETRERELKKFVDWIFTPATLFFSLFYHPLQLDPVSLLDQIQSATQMLNHIEDPIFSNAGSGASIIDSDFPMLGVDEPPIPKFETDLVRIDENFNTYPITDPDTYNVSDLSQAERDSTFGFAFNNSLHYVGFYTYEPDADFRSGQYLIWPLNVDGSMIIDLSLPAFAIYPKLYVKESVDQVDWYEEIILNKNEFNISDIRFENTSEHLKMYCEMSMVLFGGLWNIRNGLKVFHNETRSVHMITELQCTNKSFTDVGVSYTITGSPYVYGSGTDIERISIITDEPFTTELFVDEEIDITTTYSSYGLNATIHAKDDRCTSFDIRDMYKVGLINPIIQIKRVNIYGYQHEAVIMGMEGYSTLTQGEWILIDPVVTKDLTIDTDGVKEEDLDNWHYQAEEANDSSYQYIANKEGSNITVWKCSKTGTPTWTKIASKDSGYDYVTSVSCAYRNDTNTLYVIWNHGDTTTTNGQILYFWGSIDNPSVGTDKSWVGWYDIPVTVSDGYNFDSYPAYSLGKQPECGTPYWTEGVAGYDYFWWPISRRHGSGAWSNGAGWQVKVQISTSNTNLETDGTWSVPLYTGRANQMGAQSTSQDGWDGEPFYICGDYAGAYHVNLFKGNAVNATSFAEKSDGNWRDILRGHIIKGDADQELYVYPGYGMHLSHTTYPNRWRSTDDGDSWAGSNSTDYPAQDYYYSQAGNPDLWDNLVGFVAASTDEGKELLFFTWNKTSDTYSSTYSITDREPTTNLQWAVASFRQGDTKKVIISHMDSNNPSWLGYSIIDYTGNPNATIDDSIPSKVYAGKYFTFETNHTHEDGSSYVSHCFAGAGNSTDNITFVIAKGTGDLGSATVETGSAYITSVTAYGYSMTNGYRINWTVTLDWDWVFDDADDTGDGINTQAMTNDTNGVNSSWASDSANADYENDLAITGLSVAINGINEYGGTDGWIEDTDWYKGGVQVTANGTVYYQNENQVFNSSYASGVNITLMYGGTSTGQSDTIISVGIFTGITYTPTAGDNDLDTTSGAYFDAEVLAIPSGGSDVTASGIEITSKRDNENPLITWLISQTNESSVYLYYDSSSQYGYYSDNMGTTLTDFYVGGTSFDGPDNLENQDFELGDDGSWTLYQADITTSSSRVHSGTYGVGTAYYSGGLYYDGYIEQNCSIPVDRIMDFTIWVKDYATNWHIVTLYYTDETSDTQQFNTNQGDWVQVTVTIGDAGKTIGKIRIESDRTGGSSNQMSAIDDINLTVSVGSGLYSILDNTTFGNNPSNGGTNESWSFQYQIDQDDDSSGSFNVTYTAVDLVGNNDTDWFYFYLDNTNPTITWLASQTNESSIYLYYDDSSQWGYYSDNMGVTLTNFNIGGSASDTGSGVIVLVDDNTTFGNDPSNGGTNDSWSFAYSIDQDDDSSGSFNITFTASDALMNNVTDWFYFYLDNTYPLVSWLASQTNESSSYLYYDDSSQWGYYSDNMGASLHDFNVGGDATDGGCGLYDIIDNTTFGNNPSYSGSLALWTFTYSIDQDDDSSGSFNITFTISDNCYNNATVWFYFYLDNTNPSISVTWNFNANDWFIKSGSDYGFTNVDITSVQDTGSGLDWGYFYLKNSTFDSAPVVTIASGLNGDTSEKSYLDEVVYATDDALITGDYLDDEYSNDELYMRIVFWDMVGNLIVTNRYVRLDRTPPDSYSLVMESGVFYADITNDSTPLLTFSGATDNGGSGLHATAYYYQWRIDGGEWTGSGYTSSNPYSGFTITESDDVDFSGGVRDAVGNVGTFVSDSDNTIDLTDPLIELDPLTVYENSSYLYQGNELGMALDYATVNGSWGLDGWSFEEGTLEGWSESGYGTLYTTDVGWLNNTITDTGGSYTKPTLNNLNIDGSLYQYILIKVYLVEPDSNDYVKITEINYGGTGSRTWSYSSTPYVLSTGWNFILIDMSDWSAWTSNTMDILTITFYHGDGTSLVNWEADEKFYFSSIRVLTHEGLLDYPINDGQWGADGWSWLEGTDGELAGTGSTLSYSDGIINASRSTDGHLRFYWTGIDFSGTDYGYVVIRCRISNSSALGSIWDAGAQRGSFTATNEWNIYVVDMSWTDVTAVQLYFLDVIAPFWVEVDWLKVIHVPSGYTLPSGSVFNSTTGYYSDMIAEDQELWLQFNEGTGSTVYDDSPNDFTNSGGTFPTWSTDSYSLGADWCLDFESSNSEFITFADHDDFSFTEVPFSIEAWINVESYAVIGCIISKEAFGAGGREWHIRINTDGKIMFQLTHADYTAWISAYTNTVFTIGKWYHLVCTYDGSKSENGLTIYVNGVDDTTGNYMYGSYTGMTNTATSLLIGSADTGVQWWFDGCIDDVMIYRRELTASEIEKHYFGMNYFYIGGEAYDELSGLYSITDNTTFGGDPTNIGSLGNWQFVYSVTFDDNGTVVVTYTATDCAGNTATYTWNTFEEDNSVNIDWLTAQTNESSNYLWYDYIDDEQWGYYSDNMGGTPVTFNVGGSSFEDGSGVLSLVDNTSFGNNPTYTGSFSLWTFAYSIDSGDSASGSFNITFTIKDNVGNTNTTWFYFYEDNTAPSVSVTWNFNDNDYAIKSGSNYGWTDIDITSVQDIGSGLEYGYFYVKNSTYSNTLRFIAQGLNGDTSDLSYLNEYCYGTDNCESTGNYLDDEYSNNEMYIQIGFKDMCGNYGCPTRYVRLDRTPPDSYTLVMESGYFYASITNDSTPLITCSGATDSGSGLHGTPYVYNWRIDGGEWSNYGYTASTTHTPTISESQDVDFAVYVRDAVGNVGGWVYDNDNTVDLSDPSFTNIGGSEASSYLYAPSSTTDYGYYSDNMGVTLTDFNVIGAVTDNYNLEKANGSTQFSDTPQDTSITGASDSFSCTYTINNGDLGTGDVTVTIYLFDQAGNVVVDTFTFYEDNTAPTKSITWNFDVNDWCIFDGTDWGFTNIDVDSVQDTGAGLQYGYFYVYNSSGVQSALKWIVTGLNGDTSEKSYLNEYWYPTDDCESTGNYLDEEYDLNDLYIHICFRDMVYNAFYADRYVRLDMTAPTIEIDPLNIYENSSYLYYGNELGLARDFATDNGSWGLDGWSWEEGTQETGFTASSLTDLTYTNGEFNFGLQQGATSASFYWTLISDSQIDTNIYKYLLFTIKTNVSDSIKYRVLWDHSGSYILVENLAFSDTIYTTYLVDLSQDSDWTAGHTQFCFYFYDFVWSEFEGDEFVWFKSIRLLTDDGLMDYAIDDGSYGSDGWSFLEETLEGGSATEHFVESASDGYLYGYLTNSWGYVTRYPVSLDASDYTILVIRAKTNDTNLGVCPAKQGDVAVGIQKYLTTTSWTILSWVLPDDADWTGSITELNIGISNQIGSAIWVDYIRLLRVPAGYTFTNSDFENTYGYFSDQIAEDQELWLPFNEGEGTTVYDSSPNGLTQSGATFPTWSTSSYNLGAQTSLFFDSSNSEYITISDTVSINCDQSFTVMAWFYTTDVSGAEMIIGKKFGEPNGWGLFLGESTLRFQVTNDSDYAYGSEIGIVADTWYFVVAIWDYETRTTFLYVNSNLEDSDTFSSSDVFSASNTEDYSIGRRFTSTYYFDGYIDDIMIYSRVLTAYEIQHLYSGMNNFYIGGFAYDLGGLSSIADNTTIGGDPLMLGSLGNWYFAYAIENGDSGSGNWTVVYNVTDIAGNWALCNFTFIEDNTNPSGYTDTFYRHTGYGDGWHSYKDGSIIYFNSGENDYFTTTINNDGADTGAGFNRVIFDYWNIFNTITKFTLPESHNLWFYDDDSGIFTWRVYDNVGNYQEVNYTATDDITNPTCSVSSLAESSDYIYTSGTEYIWYGDDMPTGQTITITVTSTDGTSGVYAVNFPVFWEKGSWDDTASPYARDYNPNSGHTTVGTLTITAYDQVGNSLTDTITVYRDITNPSSTFTSLTEESVYLYWNSSTETLYISDAMGDTIQYFTINVTSSDQGSNPSGNYAVQFLNTTWGDNNPYNDTSSPYSHQFEITQNEGSISFFILAVDKVGNWEATIEIIIIDEGSGPNVELGIGVDYIIDLTSTTNICLNPSFENNLDNWSGTGGRTTNPHTGSYCAVIGFDGTMWLEQDITNTPVFEFYSFGYWYDWISSSENITVMFIYTDGTHYNITEQLESGGWHEVVILATELNTSKTIDKIRFVGLSSLSDLIDDVSFNQFTYSNYIYIPNNSTLYYGDDMSINHSVTFGMIYTYNGSVGISHVNSSIVWWYDNPNDTTAPYNYYNLTYDIGSLDTQTGTMYIQIWTNIGQMANDTVTIIRDITNPVIYWLATQTNESSSYLYYDGSSQYGWYGDQMPSTQTFNVGGNATDASAGVYTVIDNTTFGNNPSVGGSFPLWSFAYSIDSGDAGFGTFNITFTLYDNVGNTVNVSFEFRFDTTNPTFAFGSPIAIENSLYLYYNTTAQPTYCFYSDNMGATLTDFVINGTVSDSEVGLYQIMDNTSFGNNPSVVIDGTLWNITYQIDSGDSTYGTFIVLFTATDKVGNSATLTFTFYEDNTNPVTSFTSLTEDSVYLYWNTTHLFISNAMGETIQTFNLTVSSSDQGSYSSGIYLVQFLNTTWGDNNPYNDTSSPYSQIFNVSSNEGSTTLFILALDNVRNWETSLEIIVLEDITIPTISLNSTVIEEISAGLYYDESSSYGYYSDNIYGIFDNTNITLHTQFNEGVGPTIEDISGNDHDGTIYGDTYHSSNVPHSDFNWSLFFDGTDDYILFGDHDDFSFESFSLTFWMRLQGSVSSTVLWKGNQNALQFEYWFYWTADKIYFTLYTDSTNYIAGYFSIPSAIGNWRYVAFTYNGNMTLEGCSAYVDSSSKSITDYNSAGTYTGMTNTNAPMMMGAHWTGSEYNYEFWGNLDEVKLYTDRVLTSNEISRRYNQEPNRDYYIVGGDATDGSGSGLSTVADNTTFGYDPSNVGTAYSWIFQYVINTTCSGLYGTLYILYNVTDNVGNSNNVTFQFIVDNTDPTITWTAGQTNESSVTLYYDSSSQWGFYSDNMGGTPATFNMGGTYIEVGSGAVITDNTTFGNNPSCSIGSGVWSFGYNITSSDTIGNFNITVTIVDNVNNTGTVTVWFYFYFDNTAPTGTYTLTQDIDALVPNWDNDTTANTEFASLSDGSSPPACGYNTTYPVTYKLNDGTWGDWNNTLSKTWTLTEGTHILYIAFHDYCNNTVTYSITIYVDLTDPVLGILTWKNPTYSDNWYKSLDNTAQFNVTWTETNPYLLNVTQSTLSYEELDSSPSGAVSNFEITITSLPEGWYNVTVEIWDNAGNYLLYEFGADSDTFKLDNSAPTATFALFQDAQRKVDNYYHTIIFYTNITAQTDNGPYGGSGLPTDFMKYKLNEGIYGSWESTVDEMWVGIDQYNNTLYAKLRDNVGLESTVYLDWVICDTIYPILGWLTLNESWAPNWYDQTVSTTAQATVHWTETYPYQVNASCTLTHTNDTSPSGGISYINFTLTGEADGSYSISVTIWDNAGNSDSTLAGSEAPIQLEAGMSGRTIENWFYFYFFKNDATGLDWRDFNTSFVLDENYRNYTEVRIRGALYAQKYLNLTSSIRFVVRNYFGDIVLNQSYSLPSSFDLYITLDVNTFKVANLYDEIMNMTVERPGSTQVFTEQVMPNEIWNWDVYAAVYNITIYIHGTSTIALDRDGYSINDFQANLTLCDYAMFVDAPLIITIPQFDIQDVWGLTIFTNKDYKSTTPLIYIYLNDTLQTSGAVSSGYIVISRPTYGYYNFTVYATWSNYNDTVQSWITIESNAEVITWTTSGQESASLIVAIAWNTNKGSGVLRVYDNSSLIATDSVEGALTIVKSSVVGLHNLTMNITVEGKTFTAYADYTVSDWSATVTLHAYSESSPYVSVDKLHTATLSVTRSDDVVFSGYVYVNGTQVTVVNGAGSLTIVNYNVEVIVYHVDYVQDIALTNRTFIANDLTVTYDRLIGTMGVVEVGSDYAVLRVTFNNSYDNEMVTNFEYAVYVNDDYIKSSREVEFAVEGLASGSYTIELRRINNLDNNVDTGVCNKVPITIEAPPDIAEEITEKVILPLSVPVILIVIVVAGIALRWYLGKQKEGKGNMGLLNIQTKSLKNQQKELRRNYRKYNK
jgi:hypothetical protein